METGHRTWWGSSSVGIRFWTVFGLWSGYGVFNMVVVHYRSMLFGKPMSWTDCALYELTFAWIWAAVTPLVLSLSKRFPLGRGQSARNGAVHLAGAFFCAVLTKTVWDFTALPFVAPSMVPVDLDTFLKSVMRALDFGVLHYLIILVCHHALEYYRKYEDGRLRASQLEAKLANAQLHALKMQLHPHFLFNTLHSISELVHDDPARAETMIVRLSDFLRLTLDHVGVPQVPVEEEIDFLRRYLDIEKMRFEDRLTVEWDIDPTIRHVSVPNLILQPLVENAIKHGLSRNTDEGVLRISCKADDGKLSMKVFNNGPAPQRATANLQEPVREGVGLNNTRSRLERIYGGDHHIDFRHSAEGGFEVTIRIPIRPATAVAGAI
ncbi:MAG: histidine kinase [Bryobacterales bacterium]|nr:histidine kinase [Bryobacterales bacterium]